MTPYTLLPGNHTLLTIPGRRRRSLSQGRGRWGPTQVFGSDRAGLVVILPILPPAWHSCFQQQGRAKKYRGDLAFKPAPWEDGDRESDCLLPLSSAFIEVICFHYFNQWCYSCILWKFKQIESYRLCDKYVKWDEEQRTLCFLGTRTLPISSGLTGLCCVRAWPVCSVITRCHIHTGSTPPLHCSRGGPSHASYI